MHKATCAPQAEARACAVTELGSPGSWCQDSSPASLARGGMEAAPFFSVTWEILPSWCSQAAITCLWPCFSNSERGRKKSLLGFFWGHNLLLVSADQEEPRMNCNACSRESVKVQGPSATLGTDADPQAITREGPLPLTMAALSSTIFF